MPKLILWRIMPLVLIFSLLLAACSDLAGNVQIVATMPPQSTNAAPETQSLQLPDNPPNIANGEAIFQQNCTSCHGENGAGDGELVESGEVPRMGSFQDPVHVRQQSVEFYYDIITNGNLINLMPPWSGSLSLQDRWDVAMYVYTLHYNQEQIARGESLVDSLSTEIRLESDAELATQTGLDGEDAYAAVAYERLQSVQNMAASDAPDENIPEITLESANFSGWLSQGSPNAALPSDVTVQLQYGDFFDVAEVVDTTVDANGQFSFANVPVLSGSTYFAVAFYDGRAFVSEPLLTRDLQADNTVDITLYETTNTPNIVNQTKMELVLDYLNVPEVGTGIVTNQLNTYNNPSDYVFHLEPEGQNIRVSLLVSLPVGAIILDSADQNNFIPVQEQYAVIDTRPVYPGNHTVETSYFTPYENDAQTIDILVNNRFEGDVSITVIDPELSIVSDTFTYSEDINLGSEENPILAKVYTGTVNLQAGESVIFDIEGRVAQNTNDDSSVLTQDQLVPILAGTVILTMLVIVVIFFVLRRNRNETQREIDRLIMEISQLESMHDAGQINHDAFQQKKAELKQRLSALMAETHAE